ncbi:hypothetical protein ABGB18_24825 [Nonomuraea sp. B12E4]|uniref:hypothetical protein n=1 Tax=Nonomuraea sp. B12E4 TaxID=3153564 RepID=UPI00325F8FE3
MRQVRVPDVRSDQLRSGSEVAIARDAAISERLAAIPASDHAKFHGMLWSIVEGP